MSRPTLLELTGASFFLSFQIIKECELLNLYVAMISLDNRPVEVVEPASPPPPSSSALSASLTPPPASSPEIRVTDSPSPTHRHHLIPSPSSSPSSPPSLPPTSTVATAAAAQLLFQPFLPSPSPSSPSSASALSPRSLQQHEVVNKPQRPLPFSIDNIPKPTFGQRLLLHSLAAASAVAAAAHQQQLQQQQQQQQQLREQQQRLKAAEALKRERKRSEGAASPKLPNNSSGQPVDLSSKQQQPSSPGAKSDDKDGGDVPPGMVRGPNGQLWPAWVFCTRYSDRPSSGERAQISSSNLNGADYNRRPGPHSRPTYCTVCSTTIVLVVGGEPLMAS